MKLRKAHIRNQTYYKEDFQSSEIVKSSFHRCTFKNVDLRHSFLRSCEFREVVFERVRFTWANFAKTAFDRYAVNFYGCKFIKTNFNQLFLCSCTFEDCEFVDCKFTASDFGGSRLLNVKFIGEVEGMFSSEGNETRNGILNLILNRWRWVPTVYKNVDFSEAILLGSSFRGGVDEKEVVFGNSPRYLFTWHPRELYEYIRNYVLANCEGKKREGLLLFIDHCYKPKPGQQNAFFTRFTDDEDFVEIFRLMKAENERLKKKAAKQYPGK